MGRCLALPAGSNKLQSGKGEHHHFSMVKFRYFGFYSFWVPVVPTGSQINVPDPGVPLDRQELLRKFALPPLAAGKLRPPTYQRTSKNCLQLHLTAGTEDLQTSAIQSGETTEQCLKLHPTSTCHLSALCGTGLIL